MSWLSALPLVGNILDKILPSKDKKIDKQIAEMDLSSSENEVKNTTSQIVKEESSGNFLQRSWRPLLMYIFIMILFNNSILVPIFSYYFNITLATLSYPNDLPVEMIYAVSGYMGFRTIEKVAGKV